MHAEEGGVEFRKECRGEAAWEEIKRAAADEAREVSTGHQEGEELRWAYHFIQTPSLSPLGEQYKSLSFLLSQVGTMIVLMPQGCRGH